jgi:hypothetical protein
MQDPKRLRELARWYRNFAEKAGSPVIWDFRLRRADSLDAEAECIERTQVANHPTIGGKTEGASVPFGR